MKAVIYTPALCKCVFIQNIAMYCASLRELGFHTQVVSTKSEILACAPELLIVMSDGVGGGYESTIHEFVKPVGSYVVVFLSDPYHTNMKLSRLTEFNASEVWTYCASNVRQCASQGVHVKLVPPGYSPAIDYSDHDEHMSHATPVAVLGPWSAARRAKSLAHVKNLSVVTDAWNHEAWKRKVTSHTHMVNVHNEYRAAEANRFAPALASGLVVVSERCYGDDEDLWKGIVHFVDVRDFPRLLSTLRRADGAASRDAFRERFNFTCILKAALADFMHHAAA